jgi:tetratricopeptide (TPR) repeat protein
MRNLRHTDHALAFAAVLAVCLVFASPGIAESPKHVAGVLLPDLPAVREISRDQMREAEDLQRQAWADHDKGLYQKALPDANRAFQLDPNASLAALIAALHHGLGDPCRAVEALLLASDLHPDRELRDYIQSLFPSVARSCESRLGWLRIESEPVGAQVRVAGRRFEAPRTLGLMAGEYEFELSAPGHATTKRSIRIQPTTGAIETIVLAPLPASARPPVVIGPEAAAPASGRARRAAWALVATGVAAAATGVAMTVWSQGAVDGADELSQGGSALLVGDDLARWHDLGRKADRRQATAASLYAISGAAVLTGTILLVLDRRARARGPSARVDPVLGPSVGAVLSVEWQ